MKAVVIGANGQLGTDLMEVGVSAGHELTGLTHSDIQVENIDSVSGVLKDIQPEIVFNTAAYHVVPQCEENPSMAFDINAVGAYNAARVAADLNAVSVYFSTDYVFDGIKRAPYTERDAPNPLNVYASSKLAGEYLALNYNPEGLVLRVSGLYGKVPCRAKGTNFITLMLRLAKEKEEVSVVNDEILTPTPTIEIAKKAYEIIEQRNWGLYHLTSEGQCSWYEFAAVIFDELKLQTPLSQASVVDFPSSVSRPTYSVLENERLKEQGMASLPNWKTSLISFLSTFSN
jgi:dTDP-4-dehydrorhamnose reductase